MQSFQCSKPNSQAEILTTVTPPLLAVACRRVRLRLREGLDKILLATEDLLLDLMLHPEIEVSKTAQLFQIGMVLRKIHQPAADLAADSAAAIQLAITHRLLSPRVLRHRALRRQLPHRSQIRLRAQQDPQLAKQYRDLLVVGEVLQVSNQLPLPNHDFPLSEAETQPSSPIELL